MTTRSYSADTVPAGSIRERSLAVPLVRASAPAAAIWATIGAAFLIYTVYVFAAWIMSPDFKATIPSVPVPLAVQAKLISMRNTTLILTVIVSYLGVIHPIIRTGRLSLLGLVMLGCATTLVHDPLGNYMRLHVGYNSFPLNRGSWANFIPSYFSPHENLLPEEICIMMPPYIWYNAGLAAVFAWIWRRLDRHFPKLGNVTTILIVFLLMALTDFVTEMHFLTTGAYSYVGAIRSWCLYPGTVYQYPVYVGILTAGMSFITTSLLYYVNDKGQCWADRGVDRLRLSRPSETLVRFLAITGACHVAILGALWIPLQFFTIHGDPPPPNTPAYFINGTCGPGTGASCDVAKDDMTRQ